ncbi:MAG: hypothetical protein APZ16_02295 [Candidatus Hadarchaeum yellowstonense]|uniref:Uncharacterized protein n=1 Tax=Hadarchaeum yellowstonense TaxID=1776334 RepID=A0A147JW68_HADYE|nr:MAG: hypothetical protein APZ16_02295 [Candidatus Hadarchaeum yellowstonense]
MRNRLNAIRSRQFQEDWMTSAVLLKHAILLFFFTSTISIKINTKNINISIKNNTNVFKVGKWRI